MLRLNIDQAWLEDERRLAFAAKIRSVVSPSDVDFYVADGAAFDFWRTAQRYFRRGSGIPGDVFFRKKFSKEFIEVGLARVEDDAVYVAGSRDFFSWIKSRKEAGSRGASSKRKQTSANVSKRQQTLPSGSGSGSGSGSDSGSGSEKKERISHLLFANARASVAEDEKFAGSIENSEPHREAVEPSDSDACEISQVEIVSEKKTKRRSEKNNPLIEIWNANCGALPRVLRASSTRVKHSAARWNENPNETYWAELVKRLAASAFCNGANSSGWIANFDFFLKPGTQDKILEGVYDNREVRTSSVQHRTQAASASAAEEFLRSKLNN